MRKQYPNLILNTLHVQLEIIDMAQRGLLKLPLLPPPPPAAYGPEVHAREAKLHVDFSEFGEILGRLSVAGEF